MKELMERLKELGGKTSLSLLERQEIEEKYELVLDMKFRKTSCSDCYKDAIIEMYSYLSTHGKCRDKRNYKLKSGVVIQMGFGSPDFYTNKNLTDEIAEKYLRKFPDNGCFFAILPNDWKERVKNESKRAKQKKQSED